jgi:hypothetical protein
MFISATFAFCRSFRVQSRGCSSDNGSLHRFQSLRLFASMCMLLRSWALLSDLINWIEYQTICESLWSIHEFIPGFMISSLIYFWNTTSKSHICCSLSNFYNIFGHMGFSFQYAVGRVKVVELLFDQMSYWYVLFNETSPPGIIWV